MMALITIFIAFIAFLIGFFMGVKKEPPIKAKLRQAKPYEDLENLSEEYKNFLYYDGSEQE